MADTMTFWKNKKVFVTGHTGFKGSWLCMWLNLLGAEVTGFALDPPTEPSLYNLCRIGSDINSVIGDVRNAEFLKNEMQSSGPEIVFHMAAQPLVRESYKNPVETYEINVLGTVNLLEAVRSCSSVKSVIIITTDKCYENKEWLWGYRENEPLGGYDPYSASKACAEIVVSSYRNSFFNLHNSNNHIAAIASARAGNVIGGGDWACDRLIPDCMRALLKGDKVLIRNAKAIRPWQHVLEPLGGYLLLAQKLYENGNQYAEAWNFGPEDADAKPVDWVVEKICEYWGKDASYEIDKSVHPHEAHYLKLDCSKAKYQLGWQPRWTLEKALEKVVEWMAAYKNNKDLRQVCIDQIGEYMQHK